MLAAKAGTLIETLLEREDLYPRDRPATVPGPRDALQTLDALDTDVRVGYAYLTERTYRTLKSLIVSRTLAPGTKVAAEGLAQRLGVSRTTVKAALDQLAAGGLLEVRPQVGTFVRGLTTQDVNEVWEIRALMEGQAARVGALRASDGQRQALADLTAAMIPLVEYQEYREASYERFVALDRQLHELLVASAGNARLLDLYRQNDVHVHIASFRARRGLRRAGDAMAEHQAIADAFARRDADGASAAALRHVERSRKVVLQAMTRLGDVL